MATQESSGGSAPRNPERTDVIANLTRLSELRLQVGTDLTLGCVTIDVLGLPEPANLIMASNHALDLSYHLLQSCMRLARAQRGDDDLGPPNLGPGSLSGSF